MKRRITFVQRDEALFDAHQAELSTSSLRIRALDAVREDRITIGLDELPAEIRTVLRQSHELHLRWTTEKTYNAATPFVSRVSPGLHIFYTPLSSDQSSESLCPLLRTVFGTSEGGRDGVDCSKPETTFISPPLLSTTSSLQFHTRLPSLDSLVSFIRRSACAGDNDCLDLNNQPELLLSADSLDIDYDSISNTLTVTGLWATSPAGGWTEEIHKPLSAADQVEVGLLGAEKGIGAEEIKMGGLLGVVGKDRKLKPTMFSFPSRHHPLPQHASYTVSIPPPTGLHPTLAISMARSALKRPPAPQDATCALHTYLTLPSSIFGDQYQLGTTDPLFLQSHNLIALRSLSGETDLEAPDWVVEPWGSTWLLELATPPEDSSTTSSPSSISNTNWTVTIPLHLRYLSPSETGYQTAHLPWPIVFWACTVDDGTKMGVNPFDRTNLGWDGLFGPRTMFYQLHPSLSSSASDDHSRLGEDIDVPVLRLEHGDGAGIFQARTIELTTVVVVSLGFLWVMWKLVRVFWFSGLGSSSERKAVHAKKD